MLNLRLSLIAAAMLFSLASLHAQTPAPESPAKEVQRKIAIIVQNRASAGLSEKVPVREDLVGSRVAGKVFAAISRGVGTGAGGE